MVRFKTVAVFVTKGTDSLLLPLDIGHSSSGSPSLADILEPKGSPSFRLVRFPLEEHRSVDFGVLQGEPVRLSLYVPPICRPQLLNVFTHSAQQHSEGFAQRFALYSGKRFSGFQQFIFAHLCGYSYCTPTFQDPDVLNLSLIHISEPTRRS